MSSSSHRRVWACALSTVVALAMTTGVSQGSAETGTFEFDNPFGEAVDDSGTCLGSGATGRIAGTESTTGRFTENGPPAYGFHARGVNTYTYRVSYDDGRYIVGSGTDRFSFNAPGGHGTAFTDHAVSSDSGTLYGPDGQPLGQVIIHAVSHLTYHDANGDFMPDPGEITAEVDHFRLTCR